MKVIKWVLVILTIGLLYTTTNTANNDCTITDAEISEKLKKQFPDATHQEIEDMMFKPE